MQGKLRRLALLLLIVAASVTLAAAADEQLDDAALDKHLSMVQAGVHKYAPFRWKSPAGLVMNAVVTSFALIVVSEIGDKVISGLTTFTRSMQTFFIAALLSMKRGALVTLMGSASALALMTIMSALAGKALPMLIDPMWTQLASIALFVCFGIKLIWEGFNMDKTAVCGEHDMEEIERELGLQRKKEDDSKANGLNSGARDIRVLTTVVHDGAELDGRQERPLVIMNAAEIESDSGVVLHRQRPSLLSHIAELKRACANLLNVCFSAAFTEAFTLTFAAEWGDRSQITTLALGSSKNIWGVNIGAILGHTACTSLAVLGGRVLASRISERTITLAGGFTFLAFSLAGYYFEARR